MTEAVVLIPHGGGFVYACLPCGYTDPVVMRSDWACWGRFGSHVRWVHRRPLRPRKSVG